MDLRITKDGYVYIEAKCKRDGIVQVDITEDVQRSFSFWSDQKSA